MEKSLFSPVPVGNLLLFLGHTGLPLWSLPTHLHPHLPFGPDLADLESEPPTDTVPALMPQCVCTPTPLQYLTENASAHTGHPTSRLCCISHSLFSALPPDSPHRPAVWVWDVGVLESRCSAFPFLDAPLLYAIPFPIELCSPWIVRARVSCPLALPQPPVSFSYFMWPCCTLKGPHSSVHLAPTMCLPGSRSVYILSRASV